MSVDADLDAMIAKLKACNPKYGGSISITLPMFYSAVQRMRTDDDNIARNLIFSPFDGEIILIQGDPERPYEIDLEHTQFIFPWKIVPIYNDDLEFVGVGTEEGCDVRPYVDDDGDGEHGDTDVRGLDCVRRYWDVRLVKSKDEMNVGDLL